MLHSHVDFPIVDLSGKRRLPIGTDSFSDVLRRCVYVDKTALIVSLIDSAYKATLFCRPRRFGKSLAMSMLRQFFEAPVEGWIPESRRLFEPLAVWQAGDEYRSEQGRYPVVALSLGDCGGDSWAECRHKLADAIAMEYERHGYLRESTRLSGAEIDRFNRIASGNPREGEFERSLVWLTSMLSKHHGDEGSIVLVDEYDHPAMQGYLRGYGDRVVDFMRDWLTGALKSNDSLRIACLTGVQRVSRESIFSGLNNLVVSTPMDADFTEGFGFTEDEAARLAGFMGREGSVAEMRDWYDGYDFGGVSVYNPWSVLNYLRQGTAQVYWANTADNSVIRRLFAQARGRQQQELWDLASGGEVLEPVNLNTVFSDLDRDPAAIWGQLYLAGYVTTSDVRLPNNARQPRCLRVPNREVGQLYRDEIAGRSQDEVHTYPTRTYALPSIIVELKRTGSKGDLSGAARRGLEQIRRRNYAEGVPGNGALLWGVAFHGKDCDAVCERIGRDGSQTSQTPSDAV